MSDRKVFVYPGDAVNVEWDGRLCIHIGECGYAEGDLFVAGRDPWCQPDLSSADEVNEVVQRCPSGALVCRDSDGQVTEVAAPENTVTVSYQGPYFVQGDLAIDDAPDDMPGLRYRVALCRCGLSNNKLFCDNSHEGKLKDYGAVGKTGEPLSNSGGPLQISAMKDGPLLLSGNLTLRAASGRPAWQGDSVALCRCGASKSKPFCDGSHNAAGFKSD